MAKHQRFGVRVTPAVKAGLAIACADASGATIIGRGRTARTVSARVVAECPVTALRCCSAHKQVHKDRAACSGRPHLPVVPPLWQPSPAQWHPQSVSEPAQSPCGAHNAHQESLPRTGKLRRRCTPHGPSMCQPPCRKSCMWCRETRHGMRNRHHWCRIRAQNRYLPGYRTNPACHWSQLWQEVHRLTPQLPAYRLSWFSSFSSAALLAAGRPQARRRALSESERD